MPSLNFIRAEIERMRLQVIRQRRGIAELREAGIPTEAAEALLERMVAKVEELCAERDRLRAEERLSKPAYVSGKRINGTPARRRSQPTAD
jgi:hypothetical protein